MLPRQVCLTDVTSQRDVAAMRDVHDRRPSMLMLYAGSRR